MPVDDSHAVTAAIERLIAHVDVLTVAVRDASATLENAVGTMPQSNMTAQGVRTEEE
jgi:hypothetical protein